MRLRIEKKLQRIAHYVSLLESYAPECKERFPKDPLFEGALLHYLYLVSDGCIAAAEMVIKYKKLEMPESYFEAIDILGEYGVLPREFAYSFAKIASFRNFLAHDYEKIDYFRICDDVLNRLGEIKEYLAYLQKSLES